MRHPEPSSTSLYCNILISASNASNSVSLTDEQVRLSLLSAVEDKMKRRLRETFAQAQVSAGYLSATLVVTCLQHSVTYRYKPGCYSRPILCMCMEIRSVYYVFADLRNIEYFFLTQQK